MYKVNGIEVVVRVCLDKVWIEGDGIWIGMGMIKLGILVFRNVKS